MTRQPISKVTLGYGIAALRRYVDEMQAQAAALHVFVQQDALPQNLPATYRRVVDEIYVLESLLARFEAEAKQGGIPLEEVTWRNSTRSKPAVLTRDNQVRARLAPVELAILGDCPCDGR